MAEKRKNSKLTWFSAALLAVLLLVLAFLQQNGSLDALLNGTPLQSDSGAAQKPLSVHFIDVGQGDCSLIKTPNGAILIDAGERANAPAVIQYLREQKVTALKYIIATHPHSDHIGALPDILAAIPAENIILPQLTEINIPTTKTYENLLSAIQTHKVKAIPAKAGTSYALGDAQLSILAPLSQMKELNDMSVIARLDFGETSFLFSGDAEKAAEDALLASSAALRAQVFKAGHHGSKTSSGEALLEAVRPELVVICCGKDNSYGHPHEEAVQRFNAIGARQLRTDICGSIVVGSDGERLYQSYENEG